MAPLASAGAFLAGLVLGDAVDYYPVSVLLVLALALAAGCRFRPFGGVLFALLAGGAMLGAIAARGPEGPLPPGAVFDATLAEPLRFNRDATVGLFQDAVVETADGPAPLAGRVRVSFRGFPVALLPGDRVRITARVRRPAGFVNPGGYDHAWVLARRGVTAVASVARPEQIVVLAPAHSGARVRLERWRGLIRASFLERLSPPAAALLLAIVLGDDGRIDAATRAAFQASGTSHILSVSGSHLALVSLLLFASVRAAVGALPLRALVALTRRTGPGRIAAVATAIGAGLYAVIAGAEVATVRAWIMLAVYLVAVGCARASAPLRALAAAALIIGTVDPASVFELSFQLSFAAVLGLILAAPPPATAATPPPRWRRWLRALIGAVIVSTAASLWTAPLVAYHFNQVNWVGLAANPIVVPWIGFVLLPGALAVASAAAAGLDGAIPYGVFALLDGAARVALVVVAWFSSWPNAAWPVPSPPIALLGLIYAALLTAFSRPRHLALASAAAIAVVVYALLWWRTLAPNPGWLEVAFLDVGQGDAAVIRFPDGRTALVDGGGRFGEFDVGRLAVAPFLWDRGIRRIDLVAATHPQNDHMGGLGAILERFEIKRIITNGDSSAAEFFQRFERIRSERGLQSEAVQAGEVVLDGGGATLVVHHPVAGSIRPIGGGADNNRSLVLELRYGATSVLLAADIEAEAERVLAASGRLRPVTVLKVPHHGARGSLDPEFLLRVQPEIAVVSAGSANAYGHPADQTLEAYRLLRSRLLRTDRDGAVLMRTDGRRVEVATARAERAQVVLGRPESLQTEWRNLVRLARASSGLRRGW